MSLQDSVDLGGNNIAYPAREKSLENGDGLIRI